jgi:hypothetical protein
MFLEDHGGYTSNRQSKKCLHLTGCILKGLGHMLTAILVSACQCESRSRLPHFQQLKGNCECSSTWLPATCHQKLYLLASLSFFLFGILRDKSTTPINTATHLLCQIQQYKASPLSLTLPVPLQLRSSVPLSTSMSLVTTSAAAAMTPRENSTPYGQMGDYFLPPEVMERI